MENTAKLMPCPRCGSSKIVPDAATLTGQAMDLMVEVCEYPEALLFKGRHNGKLRARICGECGYTEMYTPNAAELYTVYAESAARAEMQRQEEARAQHPSAQLLRASDAEALSGATLVRPASAADTTEPDQLLRPGTEN